MKKVGLVSLRDYKLFNSGDRIPLGLLSIHTFLKNNGVDSTFYDLNHESIKTFGNKVQDNKYEFIGVSFTTPQFNNAHDVAKYIKYVNPDCKIVAGGPHASALPESIKDPFDYIITGAGEEKMLKLITGKHRNKTSNLVDRTLLPTNYDYGINFNGKKQATIITSTGCVGKCIFCSRKVHGNKSNLFSIDDVLKDVEQVKDLGYESIYFLDDLFTYDEDRVKELSVKMHNRYGRISNRVTTRADFLNDEVINYLSRMGTEQICLGIEHADNDVLKKNAKGMNIEESTKIIDSAHKHGIKVKGFYILNPAGSTPETAEKTIEHAEKWCDNYDIYNLVAYPGSRLWKAPQVYGMEILSNEFGYWEATDGLVKRVNIHDPVNFPADKVIEMINEVKK